MDQCLLDRVIKEMEQLLSKDEMPDWFNYPEEFLRIIEQGLLDFDPWIILQEARLRTRFTGLKERYPSRELVPFARREDNDDVACWDKQRPGLVVIIHDFSSPGSESKEEFSCFWEWFRSAVEATIAYDG